MVRRFDAIVVGSGLGGLTAAAVYARTGRKVLVLERNGNFGGAATVYRRGDLAIEASLHEINGLDESDPKLSLLQSLGLDRDLTFVDVDDLQEVRGALFGTPFVLPHGVDAALRAALARFPDHEAGLREYFRRLVAALQAIGFAVRHQGDWIYKLMDAPETLRMEWPLLREGRATVGGVLQELFGDDEAVKIALAANLLYYHDDPSEMLFLRYAIPQASFLVGGGHYVRGGSQALSDRLVWLIRQADGVLEAGREVDRLVLEQDRIAGVSHHGRDGSDLRTDFAPVVFGNAAPQRLAEMLPADRRKAFLAPFANRQLSISLWSIAVGLNRPPAEFGVRSYSTFMIPIWIRALADLGDAGALFGHEPGDRLPPYFFVDYHRIDSGLNEAGPYLGSFCGVDRLENWTGLSPDQKRRRKEQWMDRLIADLDREFPGIARAVVQREMSTAETMKAHLNTPGGAVYGFAPTGSPMEAFRFTARTNIEGLWLASAFTFGGGFSGAMWGGAESARAALALLQ